MSVLVRTNTAGTCVQYIFSYICTVVRFYILAGRILSLIRSAIFGAAGYRTRTCRVRILLHEVVYEYSQY